VSRIKEEHIFLAAALFFGLLWVFLIPPFQSPDENAHFFRSWTLAQGNIVLEQAKDEAGHTVLGAYLPRSVAALPERLDYQLVMRNPFAKFDFRHFWKYILTEDFNAGSGESVYQDISSNYSPICYLPQTAGIAIGRIFRLSPLGCFYLARVVVLLSYIVLIFMALKVLPVGKHIMMPLALLPMALGIAASLSSDVVLNGVAFLFIAYTLSQALSKSPRPLTGKEVKIFLLLCAVLALLKPVYIPIVLLLLMLPKERFRDKKSRLLFLFGCIGLTVLLMAAWNIANAQQIAEGYWLQAGGLDPKYQFHVALTRPLQFLGVVYNGYLHYPLAGSGRGLYRQFIGLLGWLDLVFPPLLYVIAGLFLALQVIVPDDGPALGPKARALLLISFALAFMGISFAMFVEATPVGSTVLMGVQGRYFTAVAPAAFLAVSGPKIKAFDGPAAKAVKSPLFTGSFMVAVLLAATYYIALRYYDF
jgi:uncharacterized membrane protein